MGNLNTEKLEKLYCPVPGAASAQARSAPRLAGVQGVQIGLLGNRKPNSDVLLQELGDQLRKLGISSSIFREKESCSLGADSRMLDEIAENCHAAIVALGD